jgi:hypothetical protein
MRLHEVLENSTTENIEAYEDLLVDFWKEVEANDSWYVFGKQWSRHRLKRLVNCGILRCGSTYKGIYYWLSPLGLRLTMGVLRDRQDMPN